jgi:hypothetical protein
MSDFGVLGEGGGLIGFGINLLLCSMSKYYTPQPVTQDFMMKNSTIGLFLIKVIKDIYFDLIPENKMMMDGVPIKLLIIPPQMVKIT